MNAKQKTKDKTIEDMFPLLKKPFKIQKDTTYETIQQNSQ